MKKLLISAAAIVCLLLLCIFANAADLPFTGIETECTGMDFDTAKLISSQAYTFTGEELAAVSDGDLVLFTFVVKAQTVCTPMTVTVTGAEGVPALTYYIPTQWTRIGMPVIAKGLSKIELDVDGELLLASASYEIRKGADIHNSDLETGQFLLEDFKYTAVSDNGIGVGAAKDVLKAGHFLYAAGSADGGKITVVDVSDPSHPAIRGQITGLGTSIRRICLCSSGTDLMVTSRQNGAYIIDVSDPDAPRLRSTYNTIEMATGFCISGNTAFICNRQNGVEVVDLTDLDHPKHIMNIRSGEVQGCLASGNILYCGLWDLCRVDMFDISDLSNVHLLGSAPLHGKGDGMAIHTVGGKTYLYAATGQHTEKLATNTHLTDLRYGSGNGLDIFDVTDPADPTWLSTSRIDGRYYFPNSDNWDAHVSEHDGHIYAYLANTYNGVYTFDVTDPAAPIRLEHVELVFPNGSANYKIAEYAGREIVFPYDQNVASRSPVSGFIVDDGVMYLAGYGSDVHIYQGGASVYTAIVPPAATVDPNSECHAYDFGGGDLQGFRLVRNGYQFYTVELHGDNLFVACGSKGILVMDKELNTLQEIATDGICFDLCFCGDTLYAAVGDAGVAVYSVSGTTLTKQWGYKAKYGTCRSVEASQTGKFLALQTGANYVELIDTASHSKTLLYKKGGAQAYHRNLLTFEGGRYLGAWSSGSNEYWFDCGENDSNSKPILIRTYDKSKNAMYGGEVQYGDRMLTMTSGGYLLFNPITDDAITGTTIKTKSIGNPTLFGNLMISCDRIYGHIYITDVSDLSAPVLLKQIDVAGNPDLAYVAGGTAYIPLGYQGMMKFDLSPYLEEPANDEEAVAFGYRWSYTTEAGKTTYYKDLVGADGAYTQGLAKDANATSERAGVLKLLQDYTITADMSSGNALITNKTKAFNLDFNGHRITNTLATRTGAYFLFCNPTSGNYTLKIHFFSSADAPGEYDHSCYTDSATRMMIGAGHGSLGQNIAMDVTVENIVASSGNMPIVNLESTDNKLVLRNCEFTTAKQQYAAVVVGTPDCTGEGGAVPCRADVTVENCTLRSGFCGLEIVNYDYINKGMHTNYYTTDFDYTLTLLGTNVFTCQPASRAAATRGVLIERQTGANTFAQTDPAKTAVTINGGKLVWMEPTTTDGSYESVVHGTVSGTTLIAARYDGGKLTAVEMVPPSLTVDTITLSGSGEEYKLFLLDSATYKPLSAAWKN